MKPAAEKDIKVPDERPLSRKDNIKGRQALCCAVERLEIVWGLFVVTIGISERTRLWSAAF